MRSTLRRPSGCSLRSEYGSASSAAELSSGDVGGPRKSWHALPSTYRPACHAELSKRQLHHHRCGDLHGEPGLRPIGWPRTLICRRQHEPDNATWHVPRILRGERYMRLLVGCGVASTPRAMDDIALLAKHDATEIPEGHGFVVHTTSGSWRGRCIRLPDGCRRALSVRTWLPE
jgi:hypothetical protein